MMYNPQTVAFADMMLAGYQILDDMDCLLLDMMDCLVLDDMVCGLRLVLED